MTRPPAPSILIALLIAVSGVAVGGPQQGAAATPATTPAAVRIGTDVAAAISPTPPTPPPTLAPFVATYEAYNEGKLAGSATLQLVHNAGSQWRADLGISGNRGFAGILGLNIQQSTVFDSDNGAMKPLSQSTVRKGLFLGKKITGTYDWSAGTARWTGDLKKERTAPIALKPGDLNGLLIDLAIIRDAAPGKQLNYRFVDGGRVRDHVYAVSAQPEIVAVGDLSYDALRVARTNGGNDETIFWVASGVPTPVRILQRTDGQDAIDLRLTEYQGVN